MKLLTIDNNAMGQNIYLYFDEATKEGIVIDAGDSFETIREAISENGVKVKGILLTHGHYDHIACANELRELTGADIYSHELEKKMLENPEHNLSIRFARRLEVTPDKLFADGDVFSFADMQLRVIHTPGHTPGGVCFYDDQNAVLFTGDTLFRESIGRSDLPSSNHGDLITGVKEKLFALPDSVEAYPGHGESTSVGYEKKHNPFVG